MKKIYNDNNSDTSLHFYQQYYCHYHHYCHYHYCYHHHHHHHHQNKRDNRSSRQQANRQGRGRQAGRDTLPPSASMTPLAAPASGGITSRRRGTDDDNDKDFTIAGEFRNDDKMADLMEHS
ncbi:hypothetical protein E2C01_078289 [Portunus trituberculatus]|uniref:Uncharacterized protein n=1 Tax=Portunus trituberculatus TaxID=210409 RepID=A0A5B7IPT9_PORTR|nr:hypothetical protein [Portunus trituberculatus]